VCGAEIFLCVLITKFLFFSYNGIILLVIADIIASIRDKHSRTLFLLIMVIVYIFCDYNVISLAARTVSFQDILSVYNAKISMCLQAGRDLLISINIILFIIYMIMVMQDYMKENARIALLNVQLQTAVKSLEEMNVQLQEYAEMEGKMGETRERNRVAREIHDTLGHTMTGLSAGIDACIAMIDYSVEGTKKQLNLLSKVARKGIEDIRRSVNALRPDALEQSDLKVAITKLMKEMMQVSNVKIYFQTTVRLDHFQPDEEDIIYRVVQESITNAVRHGKASKVWIDFHKEEKWLFLKVHDNGIGCTEIKSGFGLIHMQERIEMLSGEISYDGTDGFTIEAKIPIRWGNDYDKSNDCG
jgi:signal transduction histidine kinase